LWIVATFSLRWARQWLILPLHPAYNPNARELMNEPTTLGAYLRRERERRGLALRAISESTKVSVGLFEGLEADDISRWPGGIFRRAFVRSYAQCVGLDADDVVRRFERQYPTTEVDVNAAAATVVATPSGTRSEISTSSATSVRPSGRARLLGTAADITVAIVLAFGSAAAGSRLLWPVLLIAGYYAIGVMLTGTSPMVALLTDSAATPPERVTPPEISRDPVGPPAVVPRLQPRRTTERPRQRRGAQARA
jgi:hypothetical protein